MIPELPFISREHLIPSALSSFVVYREHVALFVYPSIYFELLPLLCVMNKSSWPN